MKTFIIQTLDNDNGDEKRYRVINVRNAEALLGT